MTNIAYRANRVTYSTFDAESTDVLRLDFVPQSITAGGVALSPRHDLEQEGYVFDRNSRVLYVRHTNAKEIDIRGRGGHPPVSYITFDDPHLAVGTHLPNTYPARLMNWDSSDWQIGAPQGKFGTFSLLLADKNTSHAAIHFNGAQIFAGADVYNAADHDAIITFRAAALAEKRFILKAKALQRIRTDWRTDSPHVSLDIVDGEGLIFDNLAYLPR